MAIKDLLQGNEPVSFETWRYKIYSGPINSKLCLDILVSRCDAGVGCGEIPPSACLKQNMKHVYKLNKDFCTICHELPCNV